ncbi:MAG: hypothetical protein DRR04_05360 [Gammaproteobacteria bacterium]|nr:MAG: hypothetical protein DRR04_05360 [Gammaproteobacteria bacterium]
MVVVLAVDEQTVTMVVVVAVVETSVHGLVVLLQLDKVMMAGMPRVVAVLTRVVVVVVLAVLVVTVRLHKAVTVAQA